MVLASEIDKNISLFKEKILNGTTIRILLVNPNNETTKIAVLRGDSTENDNSKKGNLEVRLIHYRSSFGTINI